MVLVEWMMLIGLALMCASTPGCGDEPEPCLISVNCAKDAGKLEHFWRSTGFSPADGLFQPDMCQQMIYIGGIPHGGITYVRPHNLLDLVKVEGFDTANPSYNWSQLDRVLDLFHENGLIPFFEIMGIPEGLAKPGKGKAVANLTPEQWRRLTKEVALHCIQRYGVGNVRTWYFETWNEPENVQPQTLCDYYDACSEGLKEADAKLRFGGPGTFVTLSKRFTSLLDHCDKGKNYFTGETGTRMDFISVHEKGTKRTAVTDSAPSIKEWIDREIISLKYIRANHPRFSKTLYVNNECDPKGGWWNDYIYRGGPYFPAIVSKYLSHHLRRITDGLGAAKTMISNDNAFIGSWGQRSHVARFGDDRAFELVKKPINAGMVLLSLLGDRRCELRQPELFSNVGAIASRRGDGQVAVLIYNCNETAARENHADAQWVLEKYGTARITLDLEGLPFKQATFAHYRIDKQHTNPEEVWVEMGKPASPTATQFEKMRAVQELAMLDEPREVRAKDGKLTLEFDLPMPGVSLVLLSAKPGEAPGAVTGLRAEQSPSLLGKEEVLLAWRDVDSRFLRTYEVLYSASPSGPFKRVNESDLLCTAFLHVKATKTGKGYYKVRAVDYWGRAGEESDIVTCA